MPRGLYTKRSRQKRYNPPPLASHLPQLFHICPFYITRKHERRVQVYIVGHNHRPNETKGRHHCVRLGGERKAFQDLADGGRAHEEFDEKGDSHHGHKKNE